MDHLSKTVEVLKALYGVPFIHDWALKTGLGILIARYWSFIRLLLVGTLWSDLLLLATWLKLRKR